MILAPPSVPWQLTGNHWVTLPCIHPADASIHMIGVVHAQSRGAIEFAGSSQFMEGIGDPLAQIVIVADGTELKVGSEGIAWERESGWIPTFRCSVGQVAIRGTIFAPHGRNADLSGAVIQLAVENTGVRSMELSIGLRGTFGHRQLRVRSPREFADGNAVSKSSGNAVVLEGANAESPCAIAIGDAGDGEVTATRTSWSIARSITLDSRGSAEASYFIAAGQERDGAAAVLDVMRRRGAASLLSMTRAALRQMEPATGLPNADRLISRHVFFAYFCSVARAIDDAHVYVVRSRVPWNGRGLTVRDWEALMWVLPAVQLVDQPLARELLLRVCELHGYAPGGGVHYLDGALFEPGFSLDGAAAFPIAVDAYIVESGDEKIVEEPILADSLYGAHEDIESRRHNQLPLYSTEVNPDGSAPEYPFTAHGNAVAALALEILKHTLDEKTAEKVQDSAAVRAALLRQFAGEGTGGKSVLVAATDLDGHSSISDAASASLYWLPYFDLIARDDSTYRRTVKPLESPAQQDLTIWCAKLIGPNGSDALDRIRRAPLDQGLAAELVDADGRVSGNGGDAALSGLLAHSIWYAVHALGAKA